MNASRVRYWPGSLTSAFVLSLFLTACSAGSPDPTSTLDPSSPAHAAIRTLELAERSAHLGDADLALSGFDAVLSGSDDDVARQRAMADLLDLAEASATAYQSWDTASDEPCASQEFTFAAYLLVLKAPDRPPFSFPSFYSSALGAEDDLALCRYHASEITALEAIQSMTSGLDLYPHQSSLAVARHQDALLVFDSSVFEETTLEAVLALKAALVTGFDGWNVEIGAREDGRIMTKLEVELCGTMNPEFLTEGVTTGSKVLPCPSSTEMSPVVTTDLAEADLLATNVSELHYTLEFSKTFPYGERYTCNNLYDDYGLFPYSKPGQFNETFTLIDTTTGHVVSTKTFRSTTPRCCSSGSTYYVGTRTIADCVGGRDPSSTFSESSLMSWLAGAAR